MATRETLAQFKKKVTAETKRCIDEYGLDLCEEGLQDWADTLGIEVPVDPKSYRFIYNIDLTGRLSDVEDQNKTKEFTQRIVTAFREVYGYGVDDVERYDWETL